MFDAAIESHQAGPMAPPCADLVDFATIMGANFDALPPRLRYRPLSKAIWAALMLDVGMLRSFVARATNPTDGSLAGLLQALDVLAARLVLAAIGGDMRAVNMITNLVDGPVRRRVGDPDCDDAQGVERERVIAEIEKALAS